jgi:ATP-dependent protease HslVU (ClpYQ) peptidase subunit
MSTAVVVKKNGYVAIGADTLTTYGSINERAEYIENHSKIVTIGENYFACVGHASIDLVLRDYFARLKSKPRLDSPQDIFKMALRLHQSLKDDYYLNPEEDKENEFESSQFACLIANPSGIFGLYSLRSVSEYSKFYAFGSGIRFALGAMHAVYEQLESVEEIARVGLLAAAEFDDSTGVPLEVHTLKLKA